MNQPVASLRNACCRFAISGCLLAAPAFAAEPLPIYQPKVKLADIYFHHPGAKPALKYNHDVDIVKFKGKFLAAWNANESHGEDVPGQYNFLSVSDDFEHWSAPVRLFTRDAAAENPVETDNQWQPIFINWRDETLFCAWCDYNARKTYIATSTDGVRWRNREVPTAPPSLAGKVVGFPTNHGLLTSKGVMMFPCSLSEVDEKCKPGHTRYAGVLLSADGGKTWTWSEPIGALPWSKIGEKPAEFGGELVTIWEPMLFEQADGKIGLLIRNSTAQDNPERAEKPHRMLLYSTSSDHGRTWTKARSVEVDTICSRNYAVSGVGTRDNLLMVMNDNNVQVPKRIPGDRYFLSLFCSPVCDPDLLLPGPVIQPEGGTAYYPNGFVADGKLYVAYTYPRGIHCSVIEPLPDFTRPFLLPRAGRSGLKIENGIAHFGQRQSSLGLVLTEKLTRQPKLRLAFDVNINRYNGSDWTVLTLGGKTRQRSALRAIYSKEKKTDLFQVRLHGNNWADIAPFKMKEWNHVEFELTESGFSVSVNKSPTQSFPLPLLRKICFGGLYAAPEWPQGMSWNSDVRLKLNSIVVE
ncbi:MAG: exo-alpha-sialidase [Verrucomicrobia bacterium]|nr:exo-alpha-sialidase [Verrucomicrobiota bacterium]